MKINVKILRGAECTLDVQPDLRVLEFKKMVETNLKIPVTDQKLLLKGKLLLDCKKLNDYDIKEDSKLNLVVLDNKESAPNTSKGPRKDILEIEMTKFLRKYFNESEVKKIVKEYMKEFYRKTSSCNLEDWERIATGYLNDE
ncbi:ubiquitin, putative [Pediculus humanus corporis]|uniref:Ubiquitin, putative n=1 Tax=Pediculus humanus subsp. corporis TaxID=121224 RepID=E0VAM8_PEDHC|nr:ubiquitin, putative [Pediculus humanus corporis]EEB10434.1 ubiquitin, putative [Pediculus humanus corporis]